MSTDPRSLEALRAGLRAARTRVSPRDIAKEARVSHTTVYALIGDDDPGTTQPSTIEKLWTWLDTLDTRSTSNTVKSDSDADADAARAYAVALAEIRTRLEVTAEWSHSLGDMAAAVATSARGMNESLVAMQAMIARLTDGIHTAATAPVLGGERIMPIPPEAVREATYDALLALGRTVPRRGPDERDAAKAKKA